MYLVGITLATMFLGMYAGGRKTLKDWGHECPKLVELKKSVKLDKKVDLQS